MGLTISASKSEVMLFTRKHERFFLREPADSGKNWILCATLDDVFQIFGYIFRCWVAMELPCVICTAKMPPKSKLIESGGGCFHLVGNCCIGDPLDWNWNKARFALRIYSKDTHAGKGSVPSIEGCIGPDGIYTE
jgi:hypothetical protein